ncbi:MAG TPA: AMP-binding protein [Pseudolabrys sp.]|jgi:phenylacetate-CoA ligase|nr:AMP-binding protein [Pseudolabrys sp.]
MSSDVSRAAATRARWLETLERYREDRDAPGSAEYWSPHLDTASRDELTAIQDAKIAAVVPFLYENSAFYRRRFERLGLIPGDIKTAADLIAKWPVVDKSEMTADAGEHPPYGTYTAMNDAIWAERGWMMFSSSGSTGAPRVFRYSHVDREMGAWANARALHAMDFRNGDTVFMITGYGPHVWAWGVQYALEKMQLPVIPGGGMNARARANIILRFQPTILLLTPSYALHLGRVMEGLGADPRKTAVRTLFVAGEPGLSVTATRERIQDLWGARMVEFYGCTEASPHVGGFSCPASQTPGQPVSTHLMEDIQIWEVIDPETRQPLPDGGRGLTVCTNLNSESSPQLRFLVGDYTVLDRGRCACGRTHVRAVGSFAGRADDLINLRGIKMFPMQIEQAVRAVEGTGDEFEILLTTNADGLDIMTVRLEHESHEQPDEVAGLIAAEVRTRCEIQVAVDVLARGTLPKTEFKAKRVRDERKK